MTDLTIPEMLAIADKANVLKRMGVDKTNRIIVDFCAARDSIALAREPGEEGEPLEVFPIEPIMLTFRLEDAMFGGTVFACVTCEHKVIIHPFVWESYDQLSKSTFTYR